MTISSERRHGHEVHTLLYSALIFIIFAGIHALVQNHVTADAVSLAWHRHAMEKRAIQGAGDDVVASSQRGSKITDMKPNVTFIESFLSAAEADVLLASLAKLPWARGTRMGKPVPRDEVWMCRYPYKFSGRILNPVSWTPEIESLRDRIQEAGYGSEYNSVLLNRYRNGKDSVDWHADDEPEMDSQHPIASVRLGACREFLVRDNNTRKVQPPFLLSSGSLLIMPAGFQQKYKHSVPKAETAKERINLTFRRMLLPGK